MVKNLSANAGDIKDVGSILVLGRSPGEGHSHPLQSLAWRIPWTEEALQPMGSQRVGHDCINLAHNTPVYYRRILNPVSKN